MTIHTEHPFLEPERDPVRQIRGRLGGVVTLWTAGHGDRPLDRAGLTVTSALVANGEPARLLALLDPDSDLAELFTKTGLAVVALLSWEDRDLAEAFAGQAPAPGGLFTLGTFEPTDHGPRLLSAPTWAEVDVESVVEVGWSALVTARIVGVTIGEDGVPLEHRRGRYLRP